MTEQQPMVIDRIPDGGQPTIRIARNSKTGSILARDDSDSGLALDEGEEFDELIEFKPGENPRITVIDRLRREDE